MNYPFYTATDERPSPDERAQVIVDEVLSYLGPRDVARMLLNGDHEHGIEPISGSQFRGALSLDDENGITRVTIENVVKSSDEAYTGLKNLVMSWAEDSVTDSGHRSIVAYRDAVEYEVVDFPDWLAYEFIQSELDRLQRSMYDRPEDFARELALQQLLAEGYNVGNRAKRLELWDNLIKFTYYEQFFAFELRPSQDSDEVIRQDTRSVRRWHQNPSELHNFELRRLRREFDAQIDDGDNWLQVTESDTKPRRRYDTGLDPRDDVADFVLTY